MVAAPGKELGGTEGVLSRKPVVHLEARAVKRPLPRMIDRDDEAEIRHDLGRVAQQDAALLQRFGNKRHLSAAEVADAAVHQLRAAAGRAFPEVVRFEKADGVASGNCVERDPDTGRAAADDHQIPHLALAFDGPEHRIAIHADASILPQGRGEMIRARDSGSAGAKRGYYCRTMRGVTILLCLAGCVSAADWADWRGLSRNGTSPEKNLPSKWSPSGENLAWRVPYGGRSTPVVVGNRVFLMNVAGRGADQQERVMALDADTGKVLWEYKYNVFLSDVPPHRASWAAPAADPETGNVYAFGVGGMLTALDRNGKKLWDRSLAEEMGLVTTHGGRTVAPIVEGPYVIVSGITSGWGELARAAHRFMAFDKRTGDTMWVSSPGGRPFDTTYSPPIVADVAGTRLFIAGGGDGTMHALKLWTGEPVWKYEMSKRGVNTGAALNGNVAIVSHSEENLDSSEMGLLAAVDATASGPIGKGQIKWQIKNWQGGFSSPVVDGDRLYQVDNGANLYAFDVNTGRKLWEQNLGTIQKASVVQGDGKLYVGSESGKFWILKPGQEKVEVLSEQQLGTEAQPEQVIASVAISNGRVSSRNE